MPRGLTAAQKASLAGRVKRPAFFVLIDIPGDELRAWDGHRDCVALGETWRGVGEFGSIDGIAAERSLRTDGITIGLHGIPTDLAAASHIIGHARNAAIRGVPLHIFMCGTDHDTDLPLCDPWLMWRGLCDVSTFRIGSTISISIPGEHFSSHLRRSNGLRMSHENHTARVGDQSDDIYRFLNRLAGRPKKVT